MAVLNIKSVPDALYRKLQARAKRQRRSVAQEVIEILEQAVSKKAPLSILDLQGLGKEGWAGVRGDTHVRKERDSWDYLRTLDANPSSRLSPARSSPLSPQA
jgi:hypothetical protein